MLVLGRYSFYVVVISFVLTVACLADDVENRMEKRCREYSESVYELLSDPVLLAGTNEPKKWDTCRISTETTIVGGEIARPQEFPHMALIGYGDDPTLWRCAGSLISEQWILTASHCIATPDTNHLARYARLGVLDFDSNTDDPKTYDIVRRVKHKKYSRPQAYNDIALLKLGKVVTFDKFIRPICLHGHLSPSNNTVIASGWGATSYKGPASAHLMKVSLNVMNNDMCNKEWQTVEGEDKVQFSKVLPEGVKEVNQVCAWAQGKDTCQGDSGGPIQQVLSDPYCMYNIVGVVSIGLRCGGRIPGVYVRVSPYLPWIESIVWPQQ